MHEILFYNEFVFIKWEYKGIVHVQIKYYNSLQVQFCKDTIIILVFIIIVSNIIFKPLHHYQYQNLLLGKESQNVYFGKNILISKAILYLTLIINC